jgi:hypothetical protein
VELPKRIVAVDVLRCRCGDRRRILATITQAEVIVAMLAGVEPADRSAGGPHAADWARGPPGLFAEA